MNTAASAHHSRIVSQCMPSIPFRRASNLGDSEFIAFISMQAAIPKHASVVIAALEGEIQKGYRLDIVLAGILRKAKTTLNLFPQAVAVCA